MSKSKTVTDEMFLAAARALADVVTPEQIDQGQLYPEPKDLRKVAATVRAPSLAHLLVAVHLTQDTECPEAQIVCSVAITVRACQLLQAALDAD